MHELIGLTYTELQKKLWAKNVRIRATRSLFRRTVEYKRKPKLQRKKLTEKRKAYKTDHRYRYTIKGSSGARRAAAGAPADKGQAGSCLCAVPGVVPARLSVQDGRRQVRAELPPKQLCLRQPGQRSASC